MGILFHQLWLFEILIVFPSSWKREFLLNVHELLVFLYDLLFHDIQGWSLLILLVGIIVEGNVFPLINLFPDLLLLLQIGVKYLLTIHRAERFTGVPGSV